MLFPISRVCAVRRARLAIQKLLWMKSDESKAFRFYFDDGSIPAVLISDDPRFIDWRAYLADSENINSNITSCVRWKQNDKPTTDS